MEIFSFDSLISLLTLTFLEIVLGIDNIVMIVLMTGKLDPRSQPKARKIGLVLAMGTRILLLLFLNWMIHLTDPIFNIINHEVTGRDIILFAGGLFLIWKSTVEMHEHIELKEEENKISGAATIGWVLVQIMILDIVFSLDSVITAVGMAQHVEIMISAIIVAIIIMLLFTEIINTFIKHHPTIQMLALSFLLLVGVFLVAEGFGKHINRGYIYFAMCFSLFVEVLNIRLRKKIKN